MWVSSLSLISLLCSQVTVYFVSAWFPTLLFTLVPDNQLKGYSGLHLKAGVTRVITGCKFSFKQYGHINVGCVDFLKSNNCHKIAF